jgi:hypothetical protein
MEGVGKCLKEIDREGGVDRWVSLRWFMSCLFDPKMRI